MSAAEARMRWCSKCRSSYRADFARCPIDGAVIEELDTDPLLGTTLGQHYVIDSFLGEGSMARVYRAHHALLAHRQFAIKVMTGDRAATLEMRLRFAQEADAASQLDHPNVISVVDFGKTDTGLMFLAMELIEGRSLAKVIEQDAPLAPPRALAIARQIALGLGHAHERGLVHRDLKPENVLITGSPEHVRVVDFGLAIPVDDERSTRLTSVGLAVGTPIYAAPEQTHNEPVDHRADFFALGVTLYEMLSGVTPFTGGLAELIQQNAGDTLIPIAARSGVHVPLEIEGLVRRLMRRDREDRPASATEVIAAIDQLLQAPAAVVALPPAPRRSRARWFVAMGALVAVAIGGTAVVLKRGGPERAAGEPVATNASAQPAGKPLAGESTATNATGKSPTGESIVTNPGTKSPTGESTATSPGTKSPTGESIVTNPGTKSPTGEFIATSPTGKSPTAESTGKPNPTGKPTGGTKPRPGEPLATNATARPTEPGTTKPTEPSPTGELAPVETKPVEPAVETKPVETKPVEPKPVEPKPVEPKPVAPVEPKPTKPAAPLWTTANATIGGMQVRGALSDADIRRAVDRGLSAMRACYQRTARSAGVSPAATVRITMAFDESRQARGVKAIAPAWPALAPCIATAAESLRVQTAPDVGVVDVVVDIAFTPVAP